MEMDIGILASKFYDYSSYTKGFTKPTIMRYQCAINHYCRIANVTQINQVTEQNVRDFLLFGRTERHWKAISFITICMSLRVFFAWCVKNGYMEKNPTADIEKPKVEKSLPKKLTKQDALKLLEITFNYPYGFKYLRYRNYAMFSMFLFAGLRKSELLHLKFTDVDLQNLTIFVRQGKGNKDRIIPMSFTLAQTLKKYLDERKRLNKTCPEFFCSLNRNMGYTYDGLRRLVKQMKKASGINFTIHKLRHTFATLMLDGGCDIYSLSKMMGHSDIKTTTIYLSASAELLRSQMTKHPLENLI